MQLNRIMSSETLLTYAVTTAPSPVQVSLSAQEANHAALTFVISNSGSEDVTVTQITFVLPVGPAAADLTEKNVNHIGWSASSGEWEVGPGPVEGVFDLKPKNGKQIVIGDQGLTVVLYNIDINTEVGTATITINETASQGNDPPTIQTCELAVAKFPYNFFAGNFALAAPMVEHNQPAVLSWVGSDQPGTTYTMLWADHAPCDVTDTRRWTSPNLTDTTTFMLEVQSTAVGEPVKVWFTATEIVADPDITATSLTVLEDATLTRATAGGLVADDLWAGDAQVSKSVAGFPGAKLTGAFDLDALSLSGAFAVSGDELTVNGAVKVAGGVTASGGPVSIFSAPTNPDMGFGTFKALTDGFVIGTIPIVSLAVKKQAIAVATTTTAQGQQVQAIATGQIVNNTPLSNNLTLPVAAGRTFTLAGTTDATFFVWMPVGTAPSTPGYERLGDAPEDVLPAEWG